jgi:hypothetical protein
MVDSRRRAVFLRDLMDQTRARASLMLRLSASVLVLSAVLVAAGCGGDNSTSNTTSPSEWANGVCSAITTWTDSVKSAGASLKGGNLSKTGLDSAANDVKTATDTFVSDLKSLGKPDTKAGAQAKTSIDQLSSDVDKDVQDMQSAVHSASGVSGVLTAVSSVSATLATMNNQVKSTFSELEQLDPAGELDQAFQDASACSSLNGS